METIDTVYVIVINSRDGISEHYPSALVNVFYDKDVAQEYFNRLKKSYYLRRHAKASRIEDSDDLFVVYYEDGDHLTYELLKEEIKHSVGYWSDFD